MSMDLPMPESAIRRKDWGAEFPRTMDFSFNVGSHVYVTVTDTDPCTTREQCTQILQELQKLHKETLCDIKYSFIIGGDGHLYAGRSWLENPEIPDAHKDKHGFMYTCAYFGRKGHQPTEVETKVFNEWIQFGQQHDMIDPKVNIIEDL